ncbi:MAG: bacterioferritin [Paraglaciecola sp.]|jgi:bacterioferritin
MMKKIMPPNMKDLDGLDIITDVASILTSGLRVEYETCNKPKHVNTLCEKEQDYVTRAILMMLFNDTEMGHACLTEQQLGLIKFICPANYLPSQM